MKTVVLELTPDSMNAVLKVVAPGQGNITNIVQVKDEAKQRGILHNSDLSLVEAWLFAEGNDDFILARGRAPKHGQDGQLKFLVDVSATAKFIPEPKQGGTIDYRSAMRVPFVSAGQVLAEIIPPAKGEDGYTVLGSKLHANDGASAMFILGQGVEQHDNTIVALEAGTPSFKNNTLQIRKSMEISGNVDYRTGNIDFAGSVLIQGDVLDDFEVKASENIIVQGVVNGAKIVAGGYIQCLGGILGKTKADIKATGFIEARFVDSASLCADGDIVVTKDILNSSALSLGEIKCAGSIIGGEVMALKKIEAGDIGSSVGTKTIVGIHKHFRQEVAKEQASKMLQEANVIYDKFKRWVQIPSLSPEEIDMLETDRKAVVSIVIKKKNLDTYIERLEKNRLELKDSKIRALKNLWPDAVLLAPYCKLNVMDHYPGPVYATEDISKGTLHVRREE